MSKEIAQEENTLGFVGGSGCGHIATLLQSLGENYVDAFIESLGGEKKEILLTADSLLNKSFGEVKVTVHPFSPNPPADTIWFDIRFENQAGSCNYFVFKGQRGQGKHVVEKDLGLTRMPKPEVLSITGYGEVLLLSEVIQKTMRGAIVKAASSAINHNAS